MTGCLSNKELARVLGDALSEDEVRRFDTHLRNCASCRDSLNELTAAPVSLREALGAEASEDDVAVASALHQLLNEARSNGNAITDGAPDETIGFQGSSSHLGGQSDSAPATGTAESELPGYEILEEIGRGGLGVVFRARQSALRRIVAIKMMLPNTFPGPNEVARFQLEAEAVAKIQHPNIVQVFDIVQREGNPCLCMEYVAGGNLAERLDAKPQPAEVAASLVEILARAMHSVHEAGVLHRDLKPANILLAEVKDADSGVWQGVSDGASSSLQPKITDFGLAKQVGSDSGMTDTHSALGTPSYMAPEQAGSGKPVTESADIYSLGAILYELLVGRPPFRGASALETMSQVIHEEPVPPRRFVESVPIDLETICLKCLDKEPHNRYRSASELAEELRCFIQGRPIQARPITRAARTWRWCKRNPVLASLSATIAILLLGFGIVGPIVAVAQTRLSSLEKDARKDAEEKSLQLEVQLRRANAIRLSAQAQSIRNKFPVRCLLLGIEAIETTRRHSESVLPIAHQSLLDGLAEVGGRPLFGHEGAVRIVAVSPNRRWLVTASEDATARLWDLAATDPTASPVKLTEQDIELATATISSDSRCLVVVSKDTTARLWDLSATDPASTAIVLAGHEGEVAALAISPDSRWLAIASEDKTAHIWDLTATDPVGAPTVLTGNEDEVAGLAFSPDGRWFVAASKATALLWDFSAKDASSSSVVLTGHEGSILSTAISPDGRWLATASEDKTVRLWDLSAEDPANSAITLKGHEDSVRTLTFSPDARWLVTRSDDNATRLWNLTSKETAVIPFALEGHGNSVRVGYGAGVREVAISRNGRWLVTLGTDATARLWDLSAKDPTASPVVLTDHEDIIWTVAFSPDGHWLATASFDTTARLWDLSAPNPARRPTVLVGHDGDVVAVAFSADGRWLATGSHDNTARLWDLSVKAPSVSPSVLRAHEGNVQAVLISPNGRIVTASTDQTVRLWDLPPEESAGPELILNGHTKDVWAVDVSLDGRWLVTASEDKTARLWDLSAKNPANSCVVLEGHTDVVMLARISPDGRWLATTSEDKTVRLWDLSAQDPVASSIVLEGHEDVVMAIEMSRDSRWLITGGVDATVRVWDLNAKDPATSPVVLKGHESSVLSLAVGSDSRWLATGSSDSTTRLWNLSAENPAAKPIVLTGHKREVMAVAISPNGRWLVTAGRDGIPRLWDLSATDPAASHIDLKGHDGLVWAVAISPDSRWLATASNDKTARLWDLSAKDPATSSIVMRGFDSPSWSPIAFSPDSRWLVTPGGINRGTARLWNVADNDTPASVIELKGHGRWVRAVTFTPDGRRLVTGSDKTVRLWGVNLDSIIDRARHQAGRELTLEERRQYHLD